MTNEIKEIIDKLNNSADHYILYDYEIKPLLDYITNLQEENNELKQIIDIRECQLEEMKMNKTDYTQVNILEMQLEDYKTRNNKAIEYINHEWFKREQIGIAPLQFSYEELQNVLDILRGDE